MNAEQGKLLISAIATVVAIVSLVVTFFSYTNSVDRKKVDRTLTLIALVDQAHFRIPRNAFQNFLIRLHQAHRVVSPGSPESQREEYLDVVTRYLNQHKPLTPKSSGSGAWAMIGPMGDYYTRVLACLSEGACDERIYCSTIHRELVIFAETTHKYREQISADKEWRYAEVLDAEVENNRCAE